MKTIIIATVLLTSLFKCGGSERVGENVTVSCNETATVTDFTGLDGCGVMLVLEDGTRLNPERRQYFQAPKIEEDPLYYFTLTAGDKVKISYKDVDGVDICMAGKTVFVTCITKID
ncbi:MAG TPA: hypothetical protein VK508_11120 [Cyclobacteriaceae bacterium]|nr:hypothetical protein [Cyclobacteriaceae bacterium]